MCFFFSFFDRLFFWTFLTLLGTFNQSKLLLTTGRSIDPKRDVLRMLRDTWEMRNCRCATLATSALQLGKLGGKDHLQSDHVRPEGKGLNTVPFFLALFICYGFSMVFVHFDDVFLVVFTRTRLRCGCVFARSLLWKIIASQSGSQWVLVSTGAEGRCFR